MTMFFAGSINMRETVCTQLCMRMAVPFPVHGFRRLLHRRA